MRLIVMTYKVTIYRKADLSMIAETECVTRQGMMDVYDSYIADGFGNGAYQIDVTCEIVTRYTICDVPATHDGLIVDTNLQSMLPSLQHSVILQEDGAPLMYT